MIVGVAIKQNNTIYCLHKPNRHHDVIAHMINNMKVSRPISGQQGFYDEEGEFFSREEAREIVIKNGQCKDPRHVSLLFSEDLW